MEIAGVGIAERAKALSRIGEGKRDYWAAVPQPHWLPLASFLSEKPGVRSQGPFQRSVANAHSYPVCVSDPHPILSWAQHCTARFWAAGMWVDKLGRKREKGGLLC